MSQQGWIKIHRQIRECYLWDNKEPFDKRSAWIDIILRANHAFKKTLINNALIEVERGNFITSEVKLSEAWKWDRGKVRRFLTMLEKDNMIKKSIVPNKYISIEIVNYNTYQCIENTTTVTVENTSVEGISTTTDEQLTNNCNATDEQLTNTNKNDKNDKNKKNIYIKPKKSVPVKIKYAEFIDMTEAEYIKLVTEHGEAKTKRMIEVLDNYKAANGKKYASDYRAILNWVVEKVSKELKVSDTNSKYKIV